MNTRLLSHVLLASLVGCTTVETTQEGVVGVDRPQSMLVSSEQVNEAAGQEYRKVIEGARQRGLLNRDAAQVARVRNVAARLIPQTATFRPDARSWKWEANVITANELNAWCMPGGKMAVYTGLMEKLQLTDDELAAIMGHEIAHALREHGRERISREMGTGLAIGVASSVLGLGQTAADLAGMVAQVTFTLPNSRTHETEADRIGVELAARAGFDPRGAVRVWQKMQQASAGGPPEFLSTHPSTEHRLQDLEAYAQKVMPLYQAARSAR